MGRRGSDAIRRHLCESSYLCFSPSAGPFVLLTDAAWLAWLSGSRIDTVITLVQRRTATLCDPKTQCLNLLSDRPPFCSFPDGLFPK